MSRRLRSFVHDSVAGSSPRTYEASVVGIRYDDERHRTQEASALQGTERPSTLERNTIIFERLVGRSSSRPLLGVTQIVSLGEGDSRATVRARYDVLDDLSIVAHETGSACCAERDDTPAAREADVRGLVLLRVATHNGRLVIEE